MSFPGPGGRLETLQLMNCAAHLGRPADPVIGLKLMAKAGYDPREAVGFWERMSGCPKKMIGRFCFRSNAAIPEFLSTHPSDISRIKQIEEWIPMALQFYHPPENVPNDQNSPPLTLSTS